MRVRDGGRRKERVTGHAIVARGVVVRHEPFIAPEPVHAAPGKTRHDRRFGKTLVKPLRCRSAGQTHREGFVAGLRERAKPFGDPARKRVGVVENVVPG
ncbi:hypothetical protein D3C83_52390 [compost metagenome]